MKPILFNTEMVRAILDGRKTQTRRVVKFPEGMTGRLPQSANDYLYYPGGIKRPPYKNGDVLYVRETWQQTESGIYIYRADKTEHGSAAYYNEHARLSGGWRPSIHMPREAARIFLRVKSVRAERLQSITRDGAISEGCNAAAPVLEFKGLWNSTIKPTERDLYGWDANPWVWVIEFERCENPEEKP